MNEEWNGRMKIEVKRSEKYENKKIEVIVRKWKESFKI